MSGSEHTPHSVQDVRTHVDWLLSDQNPYGVSWDEELLCQMALGLIEQFETSERNLRNCRELLKQALDSERTYRTALEMIRDKRSEDGSKLISGREAEAIAFAALSESEGVAVGCDGESAGWRNPSESSPAKRPT